MLRGKKPRGVYWVWDERDGDTWEGHAAGVTQVVPDDDKGELPPAVDVEVDPFHWDELLAFLLWLELHFGRRPIIYTGSWFIDAQGFAPGWLADYELWLTGYNDQGPDIWGKLAELPIRVIIWQQANNWRPDWIPAGKGIDRDYWLVDLGRYVRMGERVIRVSDLERLITDKSFDLEVPAPPPAPGGPFRLIWPAPLPVVVTQPFGINPQVYGPLGLKGHEGIDIRAVNGVQIMAAARGTVSRVQAVVDGGAYGIHVRINHDHPDGQFETIYAHFKQALVSLGDVIEAGHPIGLSDNTGNSAGAHLHLTLKKRGDGSDWLNKSDIVNPTPYLPDIFPGAGWRVDVNGNLRAAPNDTAVVLRLIAAGPTVRATGKFDHDWWEIEHQGVVGWFWNPGYKLRAI